MVDCGAIAPGLLESELFGHERGALTGADSQGVGAIEEADGGTLFLDEIGESLPDLQPSLLRMLDKREVRRPGRSVARRVDPRSIAATNGDLRARVNGGESRAELDCRLEVVRIQLPALRQRLEDLPLIVQHMLDALGASLADRAASSPATFTGSLTRSAWPGNMRELRNLLERSR